MGGPSAWLAGPAHSDESLFNAYFCKGQDVGDRATLAVIAASCGLEETSTEAVLSGTGELGGQLNEEIDLQLQRAMELGVSGVPGYVMGGGYLFTRRSER